MSQWYDNQKTLISNLRKLLKQHLDKANPRCMLTAEETKRLAKLEVIAEK